MNDLTISPSVAPSRPKHADQLGQPSGERAIARALVRHDRALVESMIELLIACIDEVDGDTDLEDDDPAGGNPDDAGEADESLGHSLPVYGINQDHAFRPSTWELA